MTATYRPLATVTLGSTTSSVTFSSIPATYRDLILVLSGRTSSGGAMGVGMRFNSDTGSNYANVYMLGDGTSASSSFGSSDNRMDIGFFSGTQGDSTSQIMDYMATDKHKTTLNRYNITPTGTVGRAFRWANTAAVTSINVYNASANGEVFAIGSTFNLYGVIA
jgi:hypothetical protein